MRVVLWDEFGEPDIERASRRAWCCSCEANVDVAKVDCGIGSYEYWGYKGHHVDMRDECVVCGSESLEETRCEEDEEVES